MIILKNVRIIKDNNLVKTNIQIEDDKITLINEIICVKDKDAKIIDCKNMLAIPGAIDVHVHFREPGFEYKETIKTGSMASAKGGYTVVMPMANLNPVPDNLEALKMEQDIIDKDAVIKCYPYMSLSKGQKDLELADIDLMHDKVIAISDDGHGVNNLELLKEAMIKAKKYNLVISSHSETEKTAKVPEGEYEAVQREALLAQEIGCKYHFCHVSTEQSVEAVREAKKKGFTNITCEVAPHHLIFDESYATTPNYKMAPPLRSRHDVEMVRQGLIDGTIDVVATDHAPHSDEEKSREYNKCPNGIIGIENALPIIYTEFVKTNLISYERFLDLFVRNAQKIFNIPKYGIYEGSKANIALLDIDNPHTYTKEEILSKSHNSPYVGTTYYGYNHLTIYEGKIVYEDLNND